MLWFHILDNEVTLTTKKQKIIICY